MGYGTINFDIIGGNVTGSGNAIHNYVRIQGGTVSGDIYGGYSEAGHAADSEIAISGSANVHDIYINATNTGATGGGKVTVTYNDNGYIPIVAGTIYGGDGADVIVVSGGHVDAVKAGAGDDIIGIDWNNSRGNILIDQSNKGTEDHDVLKIANATAASFTTSTNAAGATIMTNVGRTITIKGDISIRYVQTSQLSFGDASAAVTSVDASSMAEFFSDDNKLKINGNC